MRKFTCKCTKEINERGFDMHVSKEVIDTATVRAEVEALRNALNTSATQQRTRGYPTGAEWESICLQQAKALTRAENFLKELEG